MTEIERRKAKRVEVNIPAIVKLQDGELKVEVNSFSEKGLRFITSQPINFLTNERLQISLLKDNLKNYPPIGCKVVWKKQQNDTTLYGVEFTTYSDENLELIKEVLKEKRLFNLNIKDIIPKKVVKYDYEEKSVKERLEWLSKKVGVEFKYISEFGSIKTTELKRNIENLIGLAKIPLAVAGPLKVNGEYAKGIFYVPFATTQATLVESYHRGMLTATASGGVNVVIYKNQVDIAPIFVLKDVFSAKKFISWVKENFLSIKKEAEKTTSHGKLVSILPHFAGRRVILDLWFTTGDASGLNMINIAADAVCRWIVENNSDVEEWYLNSNLSSDKKPSFYNLIQGYGKSCVAEVRIPEGILNKFMNITVDEFVEYYQTAIYGSFLGGMVGINAHTANGLAAIFIACGQDVAQIVNACISVGHYEKTKDGDLYVSLVCPNIIVGTVGGGTSLPTQKECLEMLGCYGENKVEKFAEVVTAALLCGEISLAASVGSKIHAKVDIKVRER